MSDGPVIKAWGGVKYSGFGPANIPRIILDSSSLFLIFWDVIYKRIYMNLTPIHKIKR
jgi:hypothetical protein